MLTKYERNIAQQEAFRGERREKALWEMGIDEIAIWQGGHDAKFAASFADSPRALASRIRRPRAKVNGRVYDLYLSAIKKQQESDLA